MKANTNKQENKLYTYSVGIDIGGTNTVVGVVNNVGKIVQQFSISTKGHDTVEVFIDNIYKQLQPIIVAMGKSKCKGIGIGAPNGNYYSGNIEFAPNLEWKGVIPLSALMHKKFDLPTLVTNDANAAAQGEKMYGATKGMRNFIMVTLGTGVGSGFVANNEVIYGYDGNAGELGHTIAVRDGRACGCGRNGCLETYTSATGIVKTANELVEKNKNSLLNNQEPISSKAICEAAEKGDAVALEIFEYTGKILGQSLADAVAITGPEAIVLFGGLAQAGKYIFEPTKKYMEENLLVIYKNKIKLLPSLLPESDAAILGAAALVW